MKLKLALIIAFLANAHAYAQTLFTYGPYKVSSAEFSKAFRKNGENGKTSRQDITDYLKLYTDFKLKVRDARDMKLDTLVNKQEDIISFRSQIEEQYLYDTALAVMIRDKTREHAIKDIRVSHIFIPFKPEFATDPYLELTVTEEDTALAGRKIREAYAWLLRGEDFGKVAMQYSADPNVASNKGDLGFINVLVLPYALETLAYELPPGGFSAPIASGRGYHILKKTSERPTKGKLVLQQILLAVDPEASEPEKAKLAKRADSLYDVLQKGGSFEKLAVRFSDDKSAAREDGLMPAFAPGTYDPLFEDRVFGISKDGEILKPFLTGSGYHIVKRVTSLAITPESYGGSDWADAIRNNRRSELPKIRFAERTPGITGVKKSGFDLAELKRFTDSSLLGRTAYSPVLHEKSVLLEFPDMKLTMPEWLNFVRYNKYNSQVQFNKTWENFVTLASLTYYREHMDIYNETFRNDLNDFMEGNLLFEAMDQNVWKKASTDTSLQRKVYASGKSRYMWGKSADVIVFTASDSSGCARLRNEIEANPLVWRKKIEESGGSLLADSSRMDWNLIANSHTNPAEKRCTPVAVNAVDQSASFMYIVKRYDQPAQKTLEQARGQVINDCQKILEDEWIASLRRKYPVRLDPKEWEKVLKDLQR